MAWNTGMVKHSVTGESLQEYPRRIPVWPVFAVFFFLLFVQYNTVFFGHDDFGHASLSYAYTMPNVDGTSFTFHQLAQYVLYCVRNFGIGYLTIFINAAVFSCGITFTRIVASLLVMALFLLVYFLARPKNGYQHPHLTACLTVFLFGFFSHEAYRTGFYWYVALFGYLIPLVLFLAGLCLSSRWGKFRIWKACVLALLTFPVILQENVCAFALVFLCCRAIFHIVASRVAKKMARRPSAADSEIFDSAATERKIAQRRRTRWRWEDIVQLAAMFVGLVLYFQSPMRQNLGIGEGGLFARMLLRYKEILQYIFGPYNTLLFFLLSLFCVLLAVGLWKQGRKIMAVILSIVNVPLFVLMLVRLTGPFTAFGNDAAVILFTIYAAVFVVSGTLFFWDRKIFVCFLWGAVVSFGPSLAASYIVPRMLFPFQIALCVLFVYMFSIQASSFETRKHVFPVFVGVFAVMAVLGAINTGMIHKGYLANVPIQSYNDSILKITHDRLANGEDIRQATQYQIISQSRYTPDQSWFPENKFVQRMMWEYYDLPEDFVFEYVTGESGAPVYSLENFFTRNLDVSDGG
jgi:hypothetical protein